MSTTNRISKRGRVNEGRPTKYNKEILEKAKRFFDEYEPYYECPVEKQDKDGSVTTKMERVANPPASIERFAEHIKVNRSTVYDWEEQHPEFSDIVKRGIKKNFEYCANENAYTGGYNTAFTIFAAKNKLGWTDRQQVDTKVKVEIDGLDNILNKVYANDSKRKET